MTEISPPAFIWCIAGPHINETLIEIVDRKQRDIERFGWCLWAYGGSGNAHPERQIRPLAEAHAIDDRLALVMPNTGKASPKGEQFTQYRTTPRSTAIELPDGMSPVTGGKSAWAFYLTSLSFDPNGTIDVASYSALHATKGSQPLPEYLKGSHGRACAFLTSGAHKTGRDIRHVDVIGEIVSPFAVYLAR